jgi:hypothetical protein
MNNPEWDRWLREHIVCMIAYGRQRGLRGAELTAHVDHARRYAIARRNVHWAKISDEALIANRIDDAHDAGYMYSRLRSEQ